MSRFRPFWNKVWESPTLDAAASGPRKLLWELDANLKYMALITPDQASNGVMETKFLVAAEGRGGGRRADRRPDEGAGSSSASTSSPSSRRSGQTSRCSTRRRLAAFRTPEFAKGAGSEVVSRVKLKGRAAERGLVWVVPVLKLVEFTLGAVAERRRDRGR